MKLHIVICDDEQTEIEYVSSMLRRWAASGHYAVELSSYPSAESFLFNYSDDKDVDILLLDIQMREMNGMELARRIRAENGAVQIIFITGYPDFMPEGYDVSAVHYLMKPVKEARLFEALDRAVKNLSKKEKSIFLSVDGETVRVTLGDITYIESFAHFLEVSTVSGSHIVKMPFYELEGQLCGGFVRCHRSYIVNLAHVSKITKTDVVLDSGKAVPLSRRMYNDVNQALIQFFTGLSGGGK